MPKRYRVDRFPFVGSNSGYLSQPDPDLEIREGGERSFRPLYKGEGQSPKKTFLALRASVWSGSTTANGLLAKTSE